MAQNNTKQIILYGSGACHKTQFYQKYFNSHKHSFTFKDVVKDQVAAKELRSLYTNGKLNFPTVVINGKKLRNPRVSEIEKELNRD